MKKINTPSKFLLIVAILAIAFNLRPALSGIGPLAEDIGIDLNLSAAWLGLLTTLPLLAFGVISMLTSLFTKRLGIGKTLLGALVILTFGIVLRSLFGVVGLYAGTLFIGIGIAFGNVLIPALTKQNFPERAGAITSLYSSVMAVGASIAAGISVPLATSYGWGWRGALGIWAVPAFLALVIWSFRVKHIKKTNPRRGFTEALKKLSGTPLVWKMAIYMGLQSLAFYVVLAWLPTILVEDGYTSSYAGWMLSLSQATGILGSIIIPLWAGKRKDQRLIIVILVLLEIISLAGLMFPELGMVSVWVSIIGFVLGGTFGLALLLIVLRSTDADTAAELSGIVQSIGYLIAATGPLLIGIIHDVSQDWNYALVVLIGVSLMKLYAGMGAGKPGQI
ncbi:MFS transporter [Subsaximicrobium wynnwilliamsii]|uniref:MFS transporter n=1 Tax=Subsaximicrobium wynnwilliamsii TaxID=291179 RepID=A0A5C6ZN56_9FLAO|nr:MFS transporter [Subsaximicrobium wynnwilliamsii]TXD81617.1 MFS transporter [Subsaximicrobium wynnwilliamsii]TXD91055.1 MFS transporter [Subsaximicrobium wynnwilliamsii]TXE01066.1 MFS transporter [Subsaximicrobium wynnwilliamsii]